MLWLHDIRVPAVGRGVRQARNLVDALGVTLPKDVRDDLRLLISEVTTNAVRHGTPADQDPGATIRVRVGLEAQRVRVEVHDRGPGFEHAPRGSRSELDSGWGVHFVDQLADRWGAGREPDAWVVWFEVCVSHRPGTAATRRYAQHAGEGSPLRGRRTRGDCVKLARTG